MKDYGYYDLYYGDLYDGDYVPEEDKEALEDYFYENISGTEDELTDFIKGYKEYYADKKAEEQKMHKFVKDLVRYVQKQILKEAKILDMDEDDIEEMFEEELRTMEED